jgi:hypothetical protein
MISMYFTVSPTGSGSRTGPSHPSVERRNRKIDTAGELVGDLAGGAAIGSHVPESPHGGRCGADIQYGFAEEAWRSGGVAVKVDQGGE